MTWGKMGRQGTGAEGGAEALRHGGGRSDMHVLSEPAGDGSAPGTGHFSVDSPL